MRARAGLKPAPTPGASCSGGPKHYCCCPCSICRARLAASCSDCFLLRPLPLAHQTAAHPDFRLEGLVMARSGFAHQAVGGGYMVEALADLLQTGLVVVEPQSGVVQVRGKMALYHRTRRFVAAFPVDAAQQRLQRRCQDGFLVPAAGVLLALAHPQHRADPQEARLFRQYLRFTSDARMRERSPSLRSGNRCMSMSLMARLSTASPRNSRVSL